jgi:hypothetical protein
VPPAVEESQQLRLVGGQHPVSVATVPAGQQLADAPDPKIRERRQHCLPLVPPTHVSRAPLQQVSPQHFALLLQHSPSPQFTMPLGQHLPFEQVSPFRQQCSPQVSPSLQTHFPFRHVWSPPQHSAPALLKQHLRPGGQHMPCGELGIRQAFSPFSQHRRRFGEAQNWVLLQHSLPHLRASGHEMQWGPLMEPH